VDPLEGLGPAQANLLAGSAGLPPESRGAASDLLQDLWNLVTADDLLAISVAPGQAAAAELDLAAAFRHPEWSAYGVALDPHGGPYLARTELIAQADKGRAPAEAALRTLPAMDELVVRAHCRARGLGSR
jgi:succinyl-CoA synthetase beta subunit